MLFILDKDNTRGTLHSWIRMSAARRAKDILIHGWSGTECIIRINAHQKTDEVEEVTDLK